MTPDSMPTDPVLRLLLTATGRRAYAKTVPSERQAAVLETQTATYETAARILHDDVMLALVIPTWLTPDMVTAPAAVDQETLADFLAAVNDDTGITEREMGDVFWQIEGNYLREGSGPGSRFEGEMLTTVQARSHLIASFAAALLARYDIREKS